MSKMKVLYPPEENDKAHPLPVATIGNFDGVHLGHQALILELVERAKRIGGTPTVITFHPHPLQVLAPGNAPRQIQALDQKLQMIESLGIRLAFVIPFDRQFARTSAREFVDITLCKKIGIAEIYVGPNFAFGHRREGSFNLLKEMGGERGFLVGRVAQVQFRGARVSSTGVRQALLSGQVALARRLLGRPFALKGVVVHGTATGASLKAPTANLKTPNELIPCRGVYITMLSVDGRRHWGLTNIGVRPTLTSAGDLTIETHLLDFDQDIYHKEVNLEFLVRLRHEQRFNSLEALIAQIQKDVSRARRFFRWLEDRAPNVLAGNPRGC